MRPAVFAVTHANVQDCGYLRGTLGVNGTPQPGNSRADQAIQCIVQAHQRCQPASLTYDTFLLDFGRKETFYTANSIGQCELSVQMTSYGPDIVNKITDDNCSSLLQKSDGLHFLSCGDNLDMLVPVH